MLSTLNTSPRTCILIPWTIVKFLANVMWTFVEEGPRAMSNMYVPGRSVALVIVLTGTLVKPAGLR